MFFLSLNDENFANTDIKKIIKDIIGKTIVYEKCNIANYDNIVIENSWGIADYWGRTKKEFLIQTNRGSELYKTENGFDYKRYLVGMNRETMTEIPIEDPIVLSLQYLKRFLNDKNVDIYLESMKPINKLVDSIPRENQYTHILNKIYGLDYEYYNIQNDALLLSERYDQLWELKYGKMYNRQNSKSNEYKKHIMSEDIINIKAFCNNLFINAVDFYNIHGCTLNKNTNLIKNYYDEFIYSVDQELWEFYKIYNCNLIDVYIQKWILGEKDFFLSLIIKYKQKFKHYNKEVLEDTFILDNLCLYKIEQRDLFYHNSGYTYKYIELGKLFESFFSIIATELMRESENRLRKNKDIPKIGEGWVAETELFNLIKNTFSETLVEHQGQPEWLGKQRFDIYIPKFNIAVEFQGRQHFQPIAFFGGEEGYQKTIMRDMKKKQLCEENKCELIYVMENYNPNDVISKITNAMRISNEVGRIEN